MPLGLLGKKLGQTQVYDAKGVITPVTVVLAGPNRVLQVKTKEGKDGYAAVQLGFGEQKLHRVNRAVLGHLGKYGLAEAQAEKDWRRHEAKKATRGGGGTKEEKKPDRPDVAKPISAVARIQEFRDFPKALPVPVQKTDGGAKKEE